MVMVGGNIKLRKSTMKRCGGSVASVGSIVDRILAKIPNKLNYTSIFQNWEEAVGSRIASISFPYKVMIAGEKKTLILKSKKGCALELLHESPNILNAVHIFLGETLFAQIKIIQMDINE